MSRSGSSKARARPLLSITEEAATSRGVEPLIAGEAENMKRNCKLLHDLSSTEMSLYHRVLQRQQGVVLSLAPHLIANLPTAG